MKKTAHIVVCLINATIVFTQVLTLNFSYAEATSADATVHVADACTMTATIDSAHNAIVNPGQYVSEIGQTTLKVVCNDVEGYAIYAIGNANNELGNNKLIANLNGTPNSTYDIATGTAMSGSTSNWAMKVNAVSGTYAPTIQNSFGSYHDVPTTYTKVAQYNASTDQSTGSAVTSTYAAYVKSDQPAGNYDGKVKYTMVHPMGEEAPLSPQPSTAGYINYYANASTAIGTMGRQSASDDNTITLFASNFSRDGYGFAGWANAFDYATNPDANFYGPNEVIKVPKGTTDNGLALYAVWIKSAGNFQDASKVAELCGGNQGSLTAATYSDEGDSDESTWSITANLSSVSALTDVRDNQTYAIAKLTDGKCWMIENLRLADTHQENNTTFPTTLTTTNTNNPLNNNNPTNPSVILKHDYADTQTFTNLSPSSSVEYDDITAPEGWCTSASVACFDQSRLRTDNTTDRATYTATAIMQSSDVNLYSYGNFYNWYSATAGNGTFDKASGDTIGDLCPAGWYLLTGSGLGDFGLLSNSLGGYKDANSIAQQMTSSTAPTASVMSRRFRHFPNNFVNAGYLQGATFISRGAVGYYWSKTAYSENHVNEYSYYVFIGTSNVYPGIRGGSKSFGRTIRCIASTS